MGYHGCRREVAQDLLDGKPFKVSENPWDWLGSGVYFWESNPRRGIEFYKQVCARKGVDGSMAAVVGAVIDLGFCLDMATSAGVVAVQQAHSDMKAVFKAAARPMPQNALGKDRLLRKLDCAVINYLHGSRADAKLQPFDSVRGVFIEGSRAYRGAGFFRDTHVQIAVRQPSKIRGVFRVHPADLA